MPWSRSNGLNIFYEVAGEGPPLVLLHANPFDHTMWLYQIAHFSRRYRVVAIDLRGYGRSDKPEQPFTFSDMANDVVAVVRDLGFDRIALAGVSIGATLALSIALDHPGFGAGGRPRRRRIGQPARFCHLGGRLCGETDPRAARRSCSDDRRRRFRPQSDGTLSSRGF